MLDWLVFRNPHCAALSSAIESCQVRWLVTDALRAELAHVLGRGVVDAWSPNRHQLWESWDQLSETVPGIEPLGAASRLRCTDPDDQKFIDLAITRAQWLVSRDRAVLKLARRAKPLGLNVLAPQHWRVP